MHNHATSQDFAKWQDLARGMTTETLRHAARDCYRAAKAMQGHNPEKEGYYLDQAMTFDQEIYKRSKRSI